VKPELDDGGVVELVDLPAHGDEPVPILDLPHTLLTRRLRAYLTQHGLGHPTQRDRKKEMERDTKIQERERRNQLKSIRAVPTVHVSCMSISKHRQTHSECCMLGTLSAGEDDDTYDGDKHLRIESQMTVTDSREREREKKRVREREKAKKREDSKEEKRMSDVHF
jgi:hypothetical protein